MARTISRQIELPAPRTWGGRRRGAGRKPNPGRRSMGHDERLEHDPRHPVQVTLRAARGTPSFRSRAVFPTVCRAIARSNRGGFRVVHFSAQQDHIHLIVEADGRTTLRRGVQGLAIRVALAVNRLTRRKGKVWGDRYHARELRTPREVRASMVYVLLNFRKHLRATPGIDPCSSGMHFGDWKQLEASPANGPCVVVGPTTSLARVGWLRAGGPLSVHERPASA